MSDRLGNFLYSALLVLDLHNFTKEEVDPKRPHRLPQSKAEANRLCIVPINKRSLALSSTDCFHTRRVRATQTAS
eukprot:2743227-Amphidinium_carterae.2